MSRASMQVHHGTRGGGPRRRAARRVRRGRAALRIALLAAVAAALTLIPAAGAAAAGPAAQIAALNDPAATSNDFFGHAVAISAGGADALVGAYGTASGEGAAYLYMSSGGVWSTVPAATFTDPQATANDHFGYAVALSPDGTVAFVSADHAVVDAHSNAGAVYVYVSAGGVWPTSPTETILDPSASAADFFGASLAVSPDGGTLAVGAPGVTVNAQSSAGAAYVYQASGGTWPLSPTATFLDPASPTGFDLDGASVSLSNSGGGAGTLVVGAYDTTVAGQDAAGAANVYDESGGTWSTSPAATLTDPGQLPNDFFGGAVAIDANGSLIMSGAQDETERRQSDQGAVFSYVLSKGAWTGPHQTFTNGGLGGNFAYPSLSANGLTAVMGAPSLPVGVNPFGGVGYVYRAGSFNRYALSSTLADPTGGNPSGPEYFGNPSAETADGAESIIAAPSTVQGVAQGAGAAYLFDVAPMSVSSFKPTSGAPGTLVTISGSNLTGVDSVSFNGTPATRIVTVTATKVRVRVPAGATSGPITVANAEGFAATSSGSFTVS